MVNQGVLRLGFSPCPNDTFIFGALVKGLFPARRAYEPLIAEVETLNLLALSKDPLPVSKLSFATFAQVIDLYQLLPVGAALGFGCGPVLVAKRDVDLARARVGVPGKLTTAAFLLSLYTPVGEVVEMPYDQIMEAIEKGWIEAGVLIHEGRFVYQTRGLKLIVDLGAFWEEKTRRPLPLGGIFLRRDLPEEVKKDVWVDLKKSLGLAKQSYPQIESFIMAHAQELAPEVIRRHIETFVNNFTYDLGRQGREAVKLFLELAKEKGLIKRLPEDFLWEAVS